VVLAAEPSLEAVFPAVEPSLKAVFLVVELSQEAVVLAAESCPGALVVAGPYPEAAALAAESYPEALVVAGPYPEAAALAAESYPEALVVAAWPSLEAVALVVELSQEAVAQAGPCPEAAESYPEAAELAAESFPEAAELAARSFPEAALAGPYLEAALAGPYPEAAALAAESYPGALVVAGPCPEAAESYPGAAFVAVVSVADVAEPRVSDNTPVPSAASAPVSAVVVEVDIPGHPTFFAFPNVEYYARSANSDEGVGDESVHSSTGGHTNYDFYSILSTLDLRHNKSSEHCYNNPSPGHNTVSDTNDLPKDATRNHSRKTGLQQFQEQRKHWAYQALQLHPVVR
jgi:hypothetical protein